MDVNSVLSTLIINYTSFPALKLAWDTQIDVTEIGDLPKITPSHYIKENQYSTEQRLQLLSRQQRKISCRKPGVEVVVEPAIIVFQNYNYGDALSIPITIRNISKVSQKVAVLMDETFVFKFDENSQRVAKFPTGMSMSSTIIFRPEDDRDYYHKLVITTNKTRFAIPIIGIGGRGLLNAPDSIIFEKVPVKYFKTKTIPICNIGTRPGRFTLSSTGPFCVKPERAVVAPKDTFLMEVSCFSEKLGDFDGHLLIKYENGEEIYIYLKVDVINEDIKVTPTDLQCDDTYLGMKTKFLCYIENNSDITVDFKWKKAGNIESQTSSNNSLDGFDLHGGGGDTLNRAIDLLEHCGDDCLGVALSLDEQMASRKGQENLFTHDHFLIEPMIGQIQPHSRTEVYVVFSPQEPVTHVSTAYLDVTGVEDRIPVDLSGKGLGPKFRFGFELMDLGTVYLGGAHSYEIPVVNISEIQGRIEYNGIVGLSSGMSIKVEPHRLNLEPNEHGAFYFSFHCMGKPGEFQEAIKFIVSKSDEIIYVTAKGMISFPSLHFAGHEANIGQVSYGFPKTYQVSLINDSLNYVDVSLKMEEDGKDPPIDYNKILESFTHENFSFDLDPAEFTIEPCNFALSARGMQKVTLTICANQVREIRNKLICCIADKDGNAIEEVAWLPVRATCVVPVLTNESPEVSLSECYMQFPYPGEFLVKNPTALSACYCIVPQFSPKIRIQSESLVGVAKSREVTTIPFKMTCVQVGEAVAYFDLYTVGRDEKLFTYTVKVDCIPSKLEPTAKVIDFGNVNVLSPFYQTVEIVNSSPLTVPYVASLHDGGRNGDTWEINPEYAVINPHSNVIIGVTLTLQEAGPHNATLHVQMTEALAFMDIKMKANGVGPSLKFTPQLMQNDVIDFGAMFSKSERTFVYEVTNLGHHPKILDWRHVRDPVPDNSPPVEVKKRRTNNSPEHVEKPQVTDYFMRRSSFSITPAKKILQPKATMTVTFSANSSSTSAAEDDFVLWTYTPMKNAEGDTMNHLNKLSRRSLGMDDLIVYHHSFKPVISREVKCKAIYEAPNLKFSKQSLLFKIEATPSENDFELQEIIKVENVGFLPIKVHFKTVVPFSIKLAHQEEPVEEWSYEFETHETIQLVIKFDGSHLRKDKGSVFFDSKLEARYIDHPGAEIITLRGEVYFPSLTIDQRLIDFGTIVNGTESVEEFNVHNHGTYCLAYKWYIKPNTTTIQIASGNEVGTEKGEVRPLDLKQSVAKGLPPTASNYALLTSELNLFKEKDKKSPTLSESAKDEDMNSNDSLYSIPNAQRKSFNSEKFGESSSGLSLDEYGDSVQFLRGKMYRSRVLEMVGLHDPTVENEDEINYLSYNRDLTKTKSNISINEIIDIIPMAGVIPAGHSQTFTVVFFGHPDITFKTTAFCFIEGGTGKAVTIQGASTHTSVAVWPKSLDLGTMLFSDVVSKKVTVKNIGKVPMEVKLSTTSGKISEISDHVGRLEIFPMVSNIPAGGTASFQVSFIPGMIGKFRSGFWMKARYCGAIKIGIEGESLYPMLSLLLPRNLDCLPLIFVYHVIAKLVERFRQDEASEKQELEKTAIYLETASIMPSSEAMYPALPSTKISRVPSIPQPTDNTIHEVFAENDRAIANAHNQAVMDIPEFSAEIAAVDDDFDLDMLDWEFVTADCVPSVYVLSDAIERELVTNYVNKMFSTVTKSLTNIKRDDQQHILHKFRNLKLDLPEYVMELGDVIAGQETHFDLEVGNPGYISTNCHIVEGNLQRLKKRGIFVAPEEIKHISRGEIAVFSVKILLPFPKEMNPEKTMEIIDEKIYLQVKSGPRIPVTIRGKVFFPVLTVSAENVDFGTLKYNMFKTIKYEICNVSEISIEWNSSTEDENRRTPNQNQFLQGKSRRQSKPGNKLITYDEEPFQIWPISGSILPGHKESLQISFTPPELGKYLQIMRLKIGNTPFVQVKLKGALEESSLKVAPENINFGYILPYNIATSPEITVFNPNRYPVEVYVVENDRKHLKEERIKRFLLRYYGTNKLSYPYLRPGKRFPKVFKQFFRRLIDLFKKYLSLKNDRRRDRKAQKARIRAAELTTEKQEQAERKRQKKMKRLKGNALNEIALENTDVNRVDSKISTASKENQETWESKDKLEGKKKKKEKSTTKIDKGSAVKKQDLESKDKEVSTPVEIATLVQPNAEMPQKKGRPRRHFPLDKLPRSYVMREKVLLDFLRRLKNKNKRMDPNFDIYELVGNPIEKAYAFVKHSESIPALKEQFSSEERQAHQYVVAKKRPQKIAQSLTNFQLKFVSRRVIKKEDKQQTRQSVNTPKPLIATSPIENIIEYKKGTNKTESNKKPPKTKPNEVPEDLTPKIALGEAKIKPKKKSLTPGPVKSDKLSPIESTHQETVKVEDKPKQPEKNKKKKDKKKIDDENKATNVVEKEEIKPVIVEEPIKEEPTNEKISKQLTRKQKEKLKLKLSLGPTRWIIKPKEKFTFTIDFKPGELGEYNKTLTFEIGRTHQIPSARMINNRRPLGLNNVPVSYTINLKGICSLPAVSNSPEVIFPKIVDSVRDDETIHRVYVRDDDCFDFGPTIVPMRRVPAVGSKSEDATAPEVHTHRVKHKDNVSKFLVKNHSPMPAVCTLSLVHERRKYFEFQPSYFTVKPGEEQKVTLWAYPRVPDVVVEDHLVFCIKDNPDPIFFRIRVMGAQPKISMDEDILDFGRCLLNSRSVAQVTVSNIGLIPVTWRISKDTPLPEQVYAEKMSGVLQPKETAELRFLFKASRPIMIIDHAIDIEFRDMQGILGVIDVFKIAMYGEAYDVLVDIASEKEDFTLINLGVLPVGYPIIENLIMTNRGNFDIYFKFIIEPDNLSAKQKHIAKYLKDYFIIQPIEDTLASNEACIVQVVFEPPVPLDFVNEHVLKCQIVDLNMNVLVAELAIPVTVKAERQLTISSDSN